MTSVSKKLENTLREAIRKNPIIPVKTKEGILVGDVTIINDGTVKHIWQKGELIYKEVSLNIAAIKLANLLAKRVSRIVSDKVYVADQEYGRWFVESQMLRTRYQTALQNKEHNKADLFWARYCESRDKAINAKLRVEQMSLI